MDKIKVNVSLVSGLILYSCMNPSEPIASLQSQLITTIDTGGKCRDIDFNDSLIIAAADTNSFQGYSYSFSNEGIFDYVHEFDDSGSVGLHEPFVANKIIMSKNRKYFLLMDKNEGLFASQHLSINNTFTHIYSGSDNRDYIQSVALKENENEIHIATLIRQDSSCIVYSKKFLQENFHFFEDENGILWFDSEINSFEGFSLDASDLFLIDSLLFVADFQLVKIIKENSNATFSYYFSFDIPGIAETVYADSNIIFIGLGDNKGCIISPMDTTVLVMNQITIADGYSVKGIHKQNELLALACGDDGVLLYTCHSNGNFPLVSEIGRINSEYAYNAKIYNLNTIFVATKVGIQIFTIER